MPCTFTIPAAKLGEFEILHVENTMLLIDVGDRTINTTEQSSVVANAIVNDYVKSQIGYSPQACPGMFVVEGKLSINDVQKNCKKELADAQARQMAWFSTIFQMAEDEWQRNPKLSAVTATQRLAAKILGRKPVWLIEATPTLLRPCPFCTVDIKGDAIICPHCHQVINPVEFKKKQEELAKVG